MKYANSKAVPFVALVGENEMEKAELMLKNMETGEQQAYAKEDFLNEMLK